MSDTTTRPEPDHQEPPDGSDAASSILVPPAPAAAPDVPAPTSATPTGASSSTRRPTVLGLPVLGVTLCAVIALILGATIGYAASLPQRSELQRQRDELVIRRDRIQTERDGIRIRRDEAEATVRQLQADLDSSKNAADVAAGARDTCSKAATDASDLIRQYDNYLTDFVNAKTLPNGTAEQRQLLDHMKAQEATMDTQQKIATAQLATCRTAVNG